MKRKLTILVLLTLLLALFVLSVHAEEGLYYITDEADILSDEEDTNLEYSCQSISEEHNIGVYIVAVEDYTDWSNGSVYEMTEELYHEYTMGKGEERNGIMLLLSMAERDYALFVYGKEAETIFGDAALRKLEEEFLPHLGEDDWYEGFCAYMLTCSDYLDGEIAEEEETLPYVTDEADVLTEEEDLELEKLLRSISEKYNIGVYLVTVGDYTRWGDGSVYEVTYGLYHDYAMGKGEERNGIILLLSMADRDFATFVYGADAKYAFSDYALQQLEEEFLPYFGENDWYEGFRAYGLTCGEYLAKAAAGEPVEEGDGMLYLIVIGVSFLIALIVVSILKAGMKNVRASQEAKAYITRELNLTQRSDQFTHTTKTKRKIEKSDSKAEAGGGGHGRSGKF